MLGLSEHTNENDGNQSLLREVDNPESSSKVNLLVKLVKFNSRVASKRGKFRQILFPVVTNIWIISLLRSTSPDYIIPPTKFAQTLDPIRGCVAGSKSVSFFCDDAILSTSRCDQAHEKFMEIMDTFYWDITRYSDRIAYRSSLMRNGNTIGVQLNNDLDIDIDILNEAFPVLSPLEESSGRTCRAFNDPNCAPITFVHSCASTLHIASLHALQGTPGTIDYRFRIFPQPATPVNGITDSILIWIIPLYLSGIFLNMFNYALIELVSEKEGKHRDYLVSWGFTKLIHFQAWMIMNSLIASVAIVLMTFLLIYYGVFSQIFWPHILLGCTCYALSLLSIAYILSVRVSNTRSASSVASFTDLIFNLSSLGVAAIHNRILAITVSVIPTVPFFLLLRGIAFDEYSPNLNPLLSANEALLISLIVCVGFVLGGAWFVGRDTVSVSRQSVADSSDLVRVRNLIKQYPMADTLTLKGVDFTIRSGGEIVTLIGGNGAGKTTLIHSLLGIVEQTSCDEFSIPPNDQVCVCLQEDCFWESLTVMDHIDFFGVEMGSGNPEQYIDAFQLRDSLDKMCGTLSGGQKRRLSSLLAFIKSERTDARLLILDEPTTGVDVAGRRIIWEQIRLAAKSRGKSVLLTTHYLDEARELSDRIVFLKDGQVKAEGSVIDLQKLSGGYILKFDGDIQETVEEFQRIVPEIENRGGGNQLVVPSSEMAQLKPLLAHSEELERLGVISNVSLESISLENLFDDESLESRDDEIISAPIVKIPTLTDQIYAMARVRVLPVVSNWSSFFSTVIFPLFMVSFSIFARSFAFNSSAIPNVDDQFHFNLDSIEDAFNLPKPSPSLIPFIGTDPPPFVSSLSSESFQIFSIPDTTHMMDFLLNSSQWFPFAVDAVKNEIWLNPANPRSGFGIVNQIFAPNIHMTVSAYLSISEFDQAIFSNVFNMAIYIVLSLTIVSSQCATFIFDERSSFIKRLAQIEGLKPLGYWIGSCVGHLVVYLPLSVFFPILATGILGPVITDVPGHSILLSLAGIVNGIQLILFGYFFVFWYSSKESMLKYNSLAVLVLAETFVGIGTGLILAGRDQEGIYGFVLSLISPYFTISGTIAHIANARMQVCSLMTGQCDWTNGYSVVSLTSCVFGGIAQIAILVAILVFKERGDILRLLQPSFDTPWSLETSVGRELVDPSVVRERERILTTPGNQDDVLFVKLWHSYPQTPIGWRTLFPRPIDDKNNPLVPRLTWALKDLTLGIPRNQVLGILGENGAGKSTAISVLLGVTKPVAGYAGITPGCRIGFCPQVNALWAKLSGIEHIRFFATVRGAWVNEAHARDLLSMVGLSENSHGKKTREYSGGMKRRLCLAIALIGNPDVLILDEPTAGVDISGKREMWKIIKRMCAEGCSVLITTHSLEEADNLCSRISIMSHGQLIKVGTTNELKKEQEKIFVTIVEAQEKRPLTPTGATTSMDAIVRGSLGTLAVTPKRNDSGNSHEYEIDLKYTKLSEVVSLLVELKETKTIEDFFISQLSLEDVFLNTIDESSVDVLTVAFRRTSNFASWEGDMPVAISSVFRTLREIVDNKEAA